MEWSRYVFLAGVVLALVLVVPVSWFPFQVTKIAVFSIAVFLALFLFALGGGGRDMLRAHGVRLAFLVALLPLGYVLSAYFNNNPIAFMGQGLEADTVLFTILGAIAFIFAFLLFRTLRTAKMFLATALAAMVGAGIFQLLLILFGDNLIPLQVFADHSVNLIGKWNDLGLVTGFALLFLLIRAELTLPDSWLRRAGLGALIAALVLLLAIVNFFLVWAFLLGGCIVLAIIKFLTQKVEESPYGELEDSASAARAMSERIPWWSLGGIVVATMFLFAGPFVNQGLTSMFPVSALEVRPSYSSTMQIIDGARGDSLEKLLIGTGPNSFGRSWLLHKPAEVNQSAFWNLDFNVGFSTLITALGTTGFLGAILWLVPMVLVLAGLVRAVRLRILSREEKVLATSLGLASLSFFAAFIFYVPSQNILLLGLALSGVAFSFLWRQGRTRTSEEEMAPSRLRRVWVLLAMPLCLLLCVWVSFISTRHLVAASALGKATQVLQGGALDEAIERAAWVGKIEKDNPDAQRLDITAHMAKLQQIASSDSSAANAAELQVQFADLAQKVITKAQALIAQDPTDYRAHLLLGQLYEFFASLKVQGAYENSKKSYTDAAANNPFNPQIPLLLARLEAGQNHLQELQDYLSQSLKLKPNYTDAILFLVQLNVAQNDLPSAIQAAQAATQSAPGVASIWFELGLLYYSAGDTVRAIPALEQAVALVPDYANAKYFLGLSYYAQKRAADAMREFEDLSKSNPTSTEVQLILSNLRVGKPPFESAVPPADIPPEDRTTAPIVE